MNNSRVIIFEGGDGAGKTTQLTKFAVHLESLGYRVKKTRGLGGDGTDPIQLSIRQLLLSPEFPADRTLDEERLFSLGDLINAEAMERFLKEDSKNVVLWDRGYITHIAYFAAKKFHSSLINEVHEKLFQKYSDLAYAHGLLNLLFLPEDERMAMERVTSRGAATTPRLENLPFQKAVLEVMNQNYSDFIRPYPDLNFSSIYTEVFHVTRKDDIAAVSKMVMDRVGFQFPSLVAATEATE